MAGHARYTALLDACVLFPLATCDSLLSIAATGLYAPKWSARIEGEWMTSLERKTGKPAGTFIKRRDAMRSAFPDWEVPEQAWKGLEDGLAWRDVDDRHVLAAAIAGHADCIVTANLKHFTAKDLQPFGIEAIHPDQFLAAQFDLDQVAVLAAFKAQRQRLRKGQYTVETFIDGLERTGLITTAQRLRDAAALI